MYVEGFILPVKTARKEDYRRMAETVNAIFCENGATRAVEGWGVDVPEGKTTDFHRAVKREEDETVLFSWIEFPDRATRDRAMEATMKDKRLDEAMAQAIVSGPRMVWGGFETLVEVTP